MNDPRNLLQHARGMMIEQIMALEGRGHPSPRAFRSELERESGIQLSHRLEMLTDFPTGQSGSDPAPQETTDDIQSAIRRTGASTPARGLFSQGNERQGNSSAEHSSDSPLSTPQLSTLPQ
jgi:hypothetical protein